MSEIIVFLGPSLPLQQAKNILPTACYLPPVRCGDILRVMRLKPKLIAIIDGYFENTPAVWHKEILYALEKDIMVLGSSSMGALRASELYPYGMQRTGTIANAYINNTLNDDDAVAILHSSSSSKYLNLTDSLVNIHATLETALQKKIINQTTYDCIYQQAKQLFYQKRTLQQAMELVKENIDAKQYGALYSWIQTNGHIDAKKNDAVLLLESIAKNAYVDAKINKNKVTANRTAFFRALHKSVMCRPFSSYHDWLPIQEKVALFSRYLGPSYRLTRRLAYLLAVCYQLAVKENSTADLNHYDALFNENNFGLSLSANSSAWDEQNDCTATDKKQFFLRLLPIYVLINKNLQTYQNDITPQYYLLMYMKLSGEYFNYKKQISSEETDKAEKICQLLKTQESKKYQLYRNIAYCWWLIEHYAEKLNLQPQLHILQETSDSLRQQQNLYTQESLETWLATNDLDIHTYQHMITATARFNFLILQNNLDALRILAKEENVWWLLDALWLADTYVDAKKLLIDPTQLKNLIEQNQQRKDLDQYAYALDFIRGEQEFTQHIFAHC